jgi:large subunit ribosomal protein L25
MQRIELEVTKRVPDVSAHKVRRGGRLPGVIYGAGGENLLVDCDAREFALLGLGSSGAHLIRFAASESSLNQNIALVKEIQIHPVSHLPIHVDFLRVDLSKPVDAAVMLSFVGKAKGTIEGGILQPLRRELEVRALPDKLPEVIEIDVSGLDIHESIHYEDVTLPDGVEGLASDNFTIVTVLPPVVEEVVAEEEEGIEGVEGVEGATAEGGDADAAPAGDDAGAKKEGD